MDRPFIVVVSAISNKLLSLQFSHTIFANSVVLLIVHLLANSHPQLMLNKTRPIDSPSNYGNSDFCLLFCNDSTRIRGKINRRWTHVEISVCVFFCSSPKGFIVILASALVKSGVAGRSIGTTVAGA